jgi:DNA-binding phage protein
MARRSKDWEEDLSIDLRASVEARKFFYLGLLEEKYDWREALLKIIKLIGVNEYAEMVGDIKPSNLLNQLRPESNPTLNTLIKLTKPLGIELTFKDKLDNAG